MYDPIMCVLYPSVVLSSDQGLAKRWAGAAQSHGELSKRPSQAALTKNWEENLFYFIINVGIDIDTKG
jgi:hypothetical protein